MTRVEETPNGGPPTGNGDKGTGWERTSPQPWTLEQHFGCAPVPKREPADNDALRRLRRTLVEAPE